MRNSMSSPRTHASPARSRPRRLTDEELSILLGTLGPASYCLACLVENTLDRGNVHTGPVEVPKFLGSGRAWTPDLALWALAEAGL